MHLLLCLLQLFYLGQSLSANEKAYYFADKTPVVKQSVGELDTAISYLYVRERSGRNDGIDVEKFQRFVGIGKNTAWCAAFVSYCLYYGKAPKCIRSGRALAFANKDMIPIEKVLRQNIPIRQGAVLVFRQGDTPFGHVEIIYKKSNNKFYAIGGNTSGKDGVVDRDGQGVYPTIRTYQPFARLRIIGVWQ